MPKSSTRTPSRHRAPAQPLGDLDAEAVVAEEDVADPGHEHARARRGARLATRPTRAARSRRDGSTGSAVREHRLGRGVVVDRHRDVDLAVDVVEHTGDGGDHAARGTCRARRPGATGGAARACPCATSTPATSDGVGPRVDRGVDGGLPPRQRRTSSASWHRGTRGAELAHRAVQARPTSRAPCRRCGRRSRPRAGSVARASAFSSSVRVRTRSARISSISVAS